MIESIFIYLSLEIITLMGSSGLLIKELETVILTLAKKGYVLKPGKTDIMTKQIPEHQFLTCILFLLIPGINLAFIKLGARRRIKEVIEAVTESNQMRTMLASEKETYDKLNTKRERLTYLTSLMTDKSPKKDCPSPEEKEIPSRLDNHILCLSGKRLIPLAYTLEEVKVLNQVTGHFYQVGRIEDMNIAIIGMPTEETIEKLMIGEENQANMHCFKSMSEIEAKNKTFVVYPWETRQDILEKIEEIRENRKTSSVNSMNLFSNELFSSIENYMDKEEKHQVVKKITYPKR